MTARIDLFTFNLIRKAFINDRDFNQAELCRQLHIVKNTTHKYVEECKVIEALYPKRLTDLKFRIPIPQNPGQGTSETCVQ
jgi:hypothetical protein